MIHASRGPSPYVPPLEQDGIRYQQVKEGIQLGLPVRCGYLQAIDIKTGKSLWIAQIYEQTYDGIIEHDVQEEFFLRMKFWPGTREILIESESRFKYFINIDTQAVRKATPDDFPPKVKRPPPPIVPAIEYRGLRYAQMENGIEHYMGSRCGHIKANDIKSGSLLWGETIYTVPFNPDIEDDTQECYFTRMEMLPGAQDILIENEAGAKFLFNLKQQEVRPLIGKEGDYRPAPLSFFERLQDEIKEWWRKFRE